MLALPPSRPAERRQGGRGRRDHRLPRPRALRRRLHRRALHRHPPHRRARRACSRSSARVLLLDEPTAGVAQRETEAFGPLIKRIQARARRDRRSSSSTTSRSCTSICDRMYCLGAGQVIAEGAPDEVRSDPRGHRRLPRHRRAGHRAVRAPQGVRVRAAPNRRERQRQPSEACGGRRSLARAAARLQRGPAMSLAIGIVLALGTALVGIPPVLDQAAARGERTSCPTPCWPHHLKPLARRRVPPVADNSPSTGAAVSQGSLPAFGASTDAPPGIDIAAKRIIGARPGRGRHRVRPLSAIRALPRASPSARTERCTSQPTTPTVAAAPAPPRCSTTAPTARCLQRRPSPGNRVIVRQG